MRSYIDWIGEQVSTRTYIGGKGERNIWGVETSRIVLKTLRGNLKGNVEIETLRGNLKGNVEIAIYLSKFKFS